MKDGLLQEADAKYVVYCQGNNIFTCWFFPQTTTTIVNFSVSTMDSRFKEFGKNVILCS